MRASRCIMLVGLVFLASSLGMTAVQVNAQTAVTTYYPSQPSVGLMPVRRGLFGLRTGYIPVVGYTAPQAVTAYYAPAPAVTSYRVEAPCCGSSAPTTSYYAPAVSAATTTYYAPSASAATTTYYAPSASAATTTYYAPANSTPTTTYYAPSVGASTTYYAPAGTVTTYSVPMTPAMVETPGVTTYYVAPPAVMP